LNFYYNEVSRLGRALEISKLSPQQAEAESNNVYNNLKIQEVNFNISKDNYFAGAEDFLKVGGLYDEQYKAVKKAYEDTENKRFEYEKEDAVRRWASTAYLSADTDNYADCKNKLEKARVSLNILLELKDKQTYNNSEYYALYEEYEQSFTKKIKALDAFETVFSELAQESKNNEIYFDNYERVLLEFGMINSVKSVNDWPYKNIITVKDGKLAFSADSSWALTDNSNSDAINIFISSNTLDGEMNKISPFEEALSGLSRRMADYIKEPEKLKQWSYAREYIISSLIGANSGLDD